MERKLRRHSVEPSQRLDQPARYARLRSDSSIARVQVPHGREAWLVNRYVPAGALCVRNAAEEFDALELATLNNRHSEKWCRYPPEVLPSFIAEMDLPVAEPVLDAIRAALDRGDLGYAYTYTTSSQLQSVFATWVRWRFGWTVEPARVIPFPDAMRVIEVALERFTERGDAVVVDTPAYPPFFETVAASGRVLVTNDMQLREGRWQLNLQGAAKAFREGAAAYLICNPHNPTGRVFTHAELRAVLRLAARHRIAVISDEVHAPLVHTGRKHFPIASLPEAAEVSSVTAMSASKGWNISGLKCAVAVPGSAADHERLIGMRPRDRDGVGILGVEASVAAFTSGEPWLWQTLRYLEDNERLLTNLLGCFGTDVEYHSPEGTYLAWLDCRRLSDRLGITDLAQFFLDVGRVAVSDGKQYGRDGFIRLNFATSRQILEEIVLRMDRAVREVGKTEQPSLAKGTGT